jgi:hypothetical protein
VAAGARGVEKLARGKVSHKHSSRDLLNRMQKDSKWPPLYYGKVRVWDIKTNEKTTVDLPFFLPHELIHSIVHNDSTVDLLAEAGLCAGAKQHLEFIKGQLGAEHCLALGLWGDGVPCNWDRSESLECVTLSFPGLVGEKEHMRVPLTCIKKKFCIKNETFDDIMTIISWSLKAAAENEFPTNRHDESPFSAKEKFRIDQAGKKVGVPAGLVEVRGDWQFFKQIFRFPGWREKKGCCWRCKATPANIAQVGSNASWRRNRRSHIQLLQYMLEKGEGVSPIFSAPFVRADIFQIDWLHCSDLGVAPDFAGNLLYLLLGKVPGATNTDKCGVLFKSMKEFYDRTPGCSRFDQLKPTMIKQPKKSPKLRGKAAEIRCIVPWLVEVAEQYLGDAGAEGAAKLAARELLECYKCLSSAAYSSDSMANHCKRYCLQLVALRAVSGEEKVWVLKPKLHLFQEMCEMSDSRPSSCWTYRDEDFGGTLAKLSRAEGGNDGPGVAPYRTLTKFSVGNALPTV